jgi:hypothetical protein
LISRWHAVTRSCEPHACSGCRICSTHACPHLRLLTRRWARRCSHRLPHLRLYRACVSARRTSHTGPHLGFWRTILPWGGASHCLPNLSLALLDRCWLSWCTLLQCRFERLRGRLWRLRLWCRGYCLDRSGAQLDFAFCSRLLLLLNRGCHDTVGYIFSL